MNPYLKLTISLLLIAFGIMGANYFIPHRLNSSFKTMKDVWFIVAIVGVSFLTGFYFLFNSINEINKKKE